MSRSDLKSSVYREMQCAHESQHISENKESHVQLLCSPLEAVGGCEDLLCP